MMIIIDILIVISTLFVVLPVTYYITEVKGLPKWLNYMPFSCWLCSTFWSLITIYIALAFALDSYVIGIGGGILAILNAIAMKINQKNNTVSVNDI